MRVCTRRFLYGTLFLLEIIACLAFPVLTSAADITVTNNTSLGVANYFPLIDKNVPDGSIVTSSQKGFTLSKVQYDPFMIGVVTINPAVAFDGGQINAKYPVTTSGNAYVLVNGSNGPIKKGDVITSSNKPGVGMRAVKSGYVLGTALEDFTPTKPTDVKKIQLTLNFHHAIGVLAIRNKLSDIFRLSEIATYEEPTTVFKYVAAILIVVVSFILGFIFFGRIATMGVEALGRNPLASRTIQIGILLNVVITVAIIASGVLISLFILRL